MLTIAFGVFLGLVLFCVAPSVLKFIWDVGEVFIKVFMSMFGANEIEDALPIQNKSGPKYKHESEWLAEVINKSQSKKSKRKHRKLNK